MRKVTYTVFTFLTILTMTTSSAFAEDKETKKPLIPEGKPYNLKKDVYKKAAKKDVAGWVENVCIGDLNLKIKAKLDTGATTSSINADIIKTVKRDGERYVFYRIINEEFKSDVIEAKISRYTLIKPKMEDRDKIRRPVVMTEFRIGNRVVKEEVNLAERDHFAYPLLIGRNVLKDNFLVDSSQTFHTKTRCVKN